MKTLKRISALLKDTFKSRGDASISYIKNENGKCTMTNGHYMIVTELKEAIGLPEMFLVDAKRKQKFDTIDTLVNGFVISESRHYKSTDYPVTTGITNHIKEPVIQITINAEYLANIASIISKDETTVTLNISGIHDCIKVTAGNETNVGYLMPMRAEKAYAQLAKAINKERMGA